MAGLTARGPAVGADGTSRSTAAPAAAAVHARRSPPALTGDGSPGNPFVLTTAFDDAIRPAGGDRPRQRASCSTSTAPTDVTVTYTLERRADGAAATCACTQSATSSPPAATSARASSRRAAAPGRRQALGRDAAAPTAWSRSPRGRTSRRRRASTIQQRDQQHVSPRRRASTTPSIPTRTGNGAASARSGTSARWRRRPATRRGDLALQPHEPARRSPSPSATQTTGQTATVKVTARNNDGGPDAGPRVRYTITGRQPWQRRGDDRRRRDGGDQRGLGAKVGTDTLTAFVDRDGNGTCATSTPSRARSSRSPFAPLPAAGARQVGGREGGLGHRCSSSSRAAGARGRRVRRRASCRSPGAANIPVGSQLDTSKGRVALTSAADTGGAKTQTSDFYQGIFQVKQTRAEEEAQEAHGADHRSGDEGRDRAVAVRAAEGRAVGGGDHEEEEGPEGGAREAVGQRQGQVPHERQVQRRDGARHDLAGARIAATAR